MKKSTLTLLLLSICFVGMAQGKPKKHNIAFEPSIFQGVGTNAKPLIIDTIYIIHNADINRIYTLLQVGEAGVSSSDNYSINQRKLYHSEFTKVDSVLRPQILKWYPPVKKK